MSERWRCAPGARLRFASPAWAENRSCLRGYLPQSPACSCAPCENFRLIPYHHNSSQGSPSIRPVLIFHKKERACSLTRRVANFEASSSGGRESVNGMVRRRSPEVVECGDKEASHEATRIGH